MVMVFVSAMRFITGPSWADAAVDKAASAAMATTTASARFIVVPSYTYEPCGLLHIARHPKESPSSLPLVRRTYLSRLLSIPLRTFKVKLAPKFEGQQWAPACALIGRLPATRAVGASLVDSLPT